MKKILVLTAMLIQFLSALAFRIEYGRYVTISQPVYDDLYAAGGNAGDVVVTGGNVTIDPGVTIGGLLVGGGEITIDGQVNGGIRGGFGELVLNGNAAGNVDLRGGKLTINGAIGGKSVLAARRIIIGDNAAFNNDIRYWNKQGSLDFGQSLKNGKATYDPSLRIRQSEWYYLGATTLLGLLWYLGMALLMILIIQYLFSATMSKAADAVFNSTWKSIGLGFLFFIVANRLCRIRYLYFIEAGMAGPPCRVANHDTGSMYGIWRDIDKYKMEEKAGYAKI